MPDERELNSSIERLLPVKGQLSSYGFSVELVPTNALVLTGLAKFRGVSDSEVVRSRTFSECCDLLRL